MHYLLVRCSICYLSSSLMNQRNHVVPRLALTFTLVYLTGTTYLSIRDWLFWENKIH